MHLWQDCTALAVNNPYIVSPSFTSVSKHGTEKVSPSVLRHCINLRSYLHQVSGTMPLCHIMPFRGSCQEIATINVTDKTNMQCQKLLWVLPIPSSRSKGNRALYSTYMACVCCMLSQLSPPIHILSQAQTECPVRVCGAS